MIDHKAIGAGTENIPVVWSVILNGLAEGNNITQRIQTNMDKAFAQSPYIKH